MKYRTSLFFRRAASLLCLLVFLLPVFSAWGESVSFEEEVSTIFKRWRTAGGMIVIAKDGEIVYEQCYGYADLTAKDPVTPDTYFKIASVTKLVTAVAVMKLVEAGRLDLDENIGHVLGNPSYEAAHPSYPQVSVTARMLMTHTAGINDSSQAFVKRKPLRQILDPKENKSKSGFLKKQKPGTKYVYSNFGAGILGSIIESVTGKRLTDAVRELLFDDLDIDAAYDAHLVRDPEKIVTTYEANGNIQKTRSYRLNRESYDETLNPDRDYDESHGKLWIKGRDLCRIGIILCEMGVIDGQRVLREETVREMISSQSGKGGITADSPYGLNVERNNTLIRDNPDKIIYGHQGLSDGVVCNLYFDPETHFVFALVTSGCNTNAKQNRICTLTRELFALMWSAYSGE